LFDQSLQFNMTLSEPQTENWSPSRSSLQDALARLQEIDASLAGMEAPTERTRALADGLRLMVRDLVSATRAALDLSSTSDSGLYFRASAQTISSRFYEGDVYSGIAELATKLGAVTTTTGHGTVGTTGGG
jgi:hypothetical protein